MTTTPRAAGAAEFQKLLSSPPKTVYVNVPDLENPVRLRAITAADRDALEASVVTMNGTNAKLSLKNVRAKLLSLAIVDDDCKRIFSDDDVDVISQWPAAMVEPLFDAAAALAGLESGAVEAAAANFPKRRGGNSRSG